jgi:DNA-binding beta-propeller fold protein YncE
MNKIQNLSTARVAVVLALLVSTVAMTAEPILYATAGVGSKLVKIDVGAGIVSEIGGFGVPGAFAIAISPQGKLYTVTQGSPPGGVNPQLARVDLATGLATPFGVNLNPENFMGIGFSPKGKLYGVNAASGTLSQNSLYRFNLKTGEARQVGITGGCGRIMDLAWYHGTTYGVDPTSLYRINLHTGQAELVTTLHNALTLEPLTRIMGLAIDDDGNFYVAQIVPDAPLWRVDPVTGAATAVAGVSLSLPHGLEFIPTDADDEDDDDDKDADDDE